MAAFLNAAITFSLSNYSLTFLILGLFFAFIAITRARIKWLKNIKFWSSVPPVTGALRESAGLIGAIGIGEAPLGLQGTFSLWRDESSLKEFAYRGVAHTRVIKSTHREQWYAEELFARFAVIDKAGTL